MLGLPTSVSSTGFPFISEEAFQKILADIPHLFQEGQVLLNWVRDFNKALAISSDVSPDDHQHLQRSLKVVGNMAKTAGVTAPPDLWIMRQILSVHKIVGIVDHLLTGGIVTPEFSPAGTKLSAEQLAYDLSFLHARGIIDRQGEGYQLSSLPQVHSLFERLQPIDLKLPDGILPLVEKSVTQALGKDETYLMTQVFQFAANYEKRQGWVAGLYEVELGFRVLPLVLALRTKGFTSQLQQGKAVKDVVPQLLDCLDQTLKMAGYVDPAGWVTELGERVFMRGPGPFGIIRAYHGYTSSLEQLLKGKKVHSWVSRGENVAASQDANRKTFALANDALDQFCQDFGFQYDLFIEHAVGQGEASRQRFQRSGDTIAHYVGADLEDAAIDRAVAAQAKGQLPAKMKFVRQADIGEPDILLQGLAGHGISEAHGVMMVGNGFHEVRGQTNERMIDVFQQYCAAGLIVIFTEETGLSDDDLRATGWNTYHAGFRYVHDLSGQGLRPADDRDERHFTRFSWSKCARLGGYEVMADYTTRTRTIFPHPQPSGYNPAISVNYFCVPKSLLQKLKKDKH